MPYELMGYLHTVVTRGWARVREEAGQGSVEYVGLILIVAALITAVGVSGIGKQIANEIKDQIINAFGSGGMK